MAVELMNAVTHAPVESGVVNPSFTCGSQTLLKSIFATITSNSCPHHVNFHMHTVFSDGRLTPELLIQQAIEVGLSDFAITDHHSVDGYRKAKQYLDHQILPSDSSRHHKVPRLWVGVEVNAQLLHDEVHILCYGFDLDHRAIQPYLMRESVTGDRYHASAVIESVHHAGGVAVLAHPNRYRRSPSELIPEAARLGIDGIETYYAYDNPSPWRPSPKPTKMVHQLGEAYNLFHTCGTDTHGLNLLKRL